MGSPYLREQGRCHQESRGEAYHVDESVHPSRGKPSPPSPLSFEFLHTCEETRPAVGRCSVLCSQVFPYPTRSVVAGAWFVALIPPVQPLKAGDLGLVGKERRVTRFDAPTLVDGGTNVEPASSTVLHVGSFRVPQTTNGANASRHPVQPVSSISGRVCLRLQQNLCFLVPCFLFASEFSCL